MVIVKHDRFPGVVLHRRHISVATETGVLTLIWAKEENEGERRVELFYVLKLSAELYGICLTPSSCNS